jgi:hypothetical protein
VGRAYRNVRVDIDYVVRKDLERTKVYIANISQPMHISVMLTITRGTTGVVETDRIRAHVAYIVRSSR